MTDERAERRGLRLGTGLLAGVALVAFAGGALWPHHPDRTLDPAVAALAAPGSRFVAVELADGRRLAAERVVAEGDGLRLLGARGERRLRRDELADPASHGVPVRFWLGSDRYGRDVAARLLAGARLSLAVGLAAVALALALGVPVGLAAGLARGGRATALVAGIEAAQAFPRLFLLLALAAATRPSPWTLIVVLGATGWMPAARLVRAEARRIAAADYVLAARAGGVAGARLALRHVLPNALAPVAVEASLGLAAAVSAEAALSFLGHGAPPPVASWGRLIAEGRDLLAVAPWISLAPGVALALTLVGCSLVAEGLRDRLDRRGGGRGARRARQLAVRAE